MRDFEARHMIEALRSGVPSRSVGACFSEARPALMTAISEKLQRVRESGVSEGMIFTGRYGEGKTHLLNTVWSMAETSNMVVSCVSLGKETPFDRLYLLYQKLMANTYLPGAAQPGFRHKLEMLTQNSAVAGEMLAFSAKELETDKLYYLFRALLGTQEEEEAFAFLSDLEGDFTTASLIKRSYKRITGKTAKFNQTFSKTKHGFDYFRFMSHFFRQLGYDGWVILFDEAELLGRLSKKTRCKCYKEMQSFLGAGRDLEAVFSMIAFSSSYIEDVIDGKNDFSNVNECFGEDGESRMAAEASLNAILKAPELVPLSRAEIGEILLRIQEFHGKAYDWKPALSAAALLEASEGSGYLLRTKIRAAIELLDQLYQYGEAGKVKISELGKESFEEDEVPEL